jgi:site-specific recombinase XerD
MTTIDTLTRGGALTATLPELIRFTNDWLNNRDLAENTRKAYKPIIVRWLTWCANADISPMHAKFTHVNTYARDLAQFGNTRTGGPMAKSTVAQHMAGLWSWYDFLANMELIDRNPVNGADRPKVDPSHSATRWVSEPETDAMILAARNDSLCSYAAVMVMADMGMRVSSVFDLRIEDLDWDSEGTVWATYVIKGGRTRRRQLTPGAGKALLAYLAERADQAGVDIADLPYGPVFYGPRGGALDRHAAFRVVRRLAKKAGLHRWEKVTPHSFRHGLATNSRRRGIAIEDVQEALDHANINTTRRYDGDKFNPDREPGRVQELEREKRLALAA